MVTVPIVEINFWNSRPGLFPGNGSLVSTAIRSYDNARLPLVDLVIAMLQARQKEEDFSEKVARSTGLLKRFWAFRQQRAENRHIQLTTRAVRLIQQRLRARSWNDPRWKVSKLNGPFQELSSQNEAGDLIQDLNSATNVWFAVRWPPST